MAFVYDNKTYRNLQQQVKENMLDIARLQDSKIVGIDVAGIVADYSSLPSSAEQGQLYAVGTSSPFELYVYNNSSWVDFGQFPKAGPKGEQGPRGQDGLPGPKGLTGDQGPRGYTGAPGVPGQAGPKGEQGPQGIQGPEGPRGYKGDKGDPFVYSDFTAEQLEALRGPQGPIGLTGPKGDTGPIGPQGPKGDTGPQGPKGATGATGAAFTYDMFTAEQLEGLSGPQGIQGPKGDKGDTGATGATGPKGDTGPQGPQGVQGPQGPQGPKGDKGDPTSITVNETEYVSDSSGKITLPSFLKLTGGTLTGNLTGKYITGTLLQTTAANDLGKAPTKYGVIDNSGWLYTRTLDETKTDLGISNKLDRSSFQDFINNPFGYVDDAGSYDAWSYLIGAELGFIDTPHPTYYLHTINAYQSSSPISFVAFSVISTQSTAYTKATLYNAFQNKVFHASGYCESFVKADGRINYVYLDSATTIKMYHGNNTGTSQTYGGSYFADEVKRIA